MAMEVVCETLAKQYISYRSMQSIYVNAGKRAQQRLHESQRHRKLMHKLVRDSQTTCQDTQTILQCSMKDVSGPSQPQANTQHDRCLTTHCMALEQHQGYLRIKQALPPSPLS